MQKMKQNLVERQKSKVESQEPRGKRRKHKVVKWEYVTKPFDVKVLPDLITRLHTPLVPWLSSLTENCYVHLRPCVQGVDEDGAVVKYLYCTRDGRFFARGKDGWNEILASNHTHIRHNKAVGGSAGCPQLQHHGQKYAHRCVAFAWLDVPEDVRSQISDIRRQESEVKWEVDHLNTDHENWTADNLQFVTAAENRRRGAIARRMRKIGLDPKLLTPTLCKGIYTLPEGRLEEFIGRFLFVSKDLEAPMDVMSIRLCVATALDWMKASAANINC